MDIKTNKIIISQDLSLAKEMIFSSLKGEIVKLFESDEFLLEDAKAVTKEAYIKEERIKYIVIVAKSLNIYAQNSLLKILEESPSNTIFILISNSKSNFLPTIRSRMVIENLQAEKRERDLKIDLSKMTLNDILEFVKSNQRVSKVELKELLQDIFYEAIHTYDMRFDENELEVFENALKLANLNSRASNLLFLVLVTIFDRRFKNEDRKTFK